METCDLIELSLDVLLLCFKFSSEMLLDVEIFDVVDTILWLPGLFCSICNTSFSFRWPVGVPGALIVEVRESDFT